MGIAFLCQEPSVFKKLKVIENLIAIFEIVGVKGKPAEEKAGGLLADFKLEHVKDQQAYTLSGGERRRVEIARSLISSPKFLLLDEPFTGIDPIARAELQEVILKLKERGIGFERNPLVEKTRRERDKSNRPGHDLLRDRQVWVLAPRAPFEEGLADHEKARLGKAFIYAPRPLQHGTYRCDKK